MLIRAIYFIFLLISFSGFSQGVVKGVVYDSFHHPISFSTVILDNQIQTAGVEGEYEFKLTAPNFYTLQCKSPGFISAYRKFYFSGKDTIINIFLKEDIVQSDSIVLSVRKNNFFNKGDVVQKEEVSKEKLNKEQTSSLSKSLEFITGVNAISVSNTVTKPTIRGLQHYRLGVIEDGISQEGQQWGDDHGLEFNQFAIEKLEVYKGVSSLKYHSGAGGTIVSERFKLMPKNDHKAITKFNYESVNNLLGFNAGVKGNQDGLVYKFTFTKNTYQDYKVPTDSYSYLTFFLPIEDNTLANTSGFGSHVFGLIGVNKKKICSIISFSNDTQKYGLFSGTEGIPRFYTLDISDSRNFELPHRTATHNKVVSNTQVKFKKSLLEIDLGFQLNERKEFENPKAHGFVGLDDSDTLGIHLLLSTYSANISYNKYVEKGQYLLGYSGKYQDNKKLNSFDHFIPSYTTSESALFGWYKYKLKKNVFSIGYRIDFIDKKIQESSRIFYYDGFEEIIINPNNDFNYTNLNHSLVLGLSRQINNTNLKVSLKKFSRTPTIAELSANGNHHGVARFERGKNDLNIENGLTLNSSLHKSSKMLKVKFTPYLTYFFNYFSLLPQAKFPTITIEGELHPYVDAGQLYQYESVSAVHYGFETEIDFIINKSITTSIDAEFIEGFNLESNIYLPFIPQNTIKHELHLKTEKVLDNSYFIWRNNYYFKKSNVALNELETQGFYKSDILFGTKKKTKIGEFSFSVQMNNLFDQKYFLHINPLRRLGIPEPSRNFSFHLGWNLYRHLH